MPDIIIKHGSVLTMDKERRIIDDGAVVISGSKIEATGKSKEILGKYRADTIIDAVDKIVMPGFINVHTHVIQILLRGGLSQDRELYDWLFNVLYPGLAVYTGEDASVATTLYCAEAIRSGITTIVDNEDQGRSDECAVATIKEFARTGIRAVYAREFFDFNPPHMGKLVEATMSKAPGVKHAQDLFETSEQAIAHTESLMDRFHNSENGRIQVWPAPSIPDTTTEKGLLQALELAKKHDVMVAIHLAEAPLEANMYGMTSTEFLYSIGFLHPRILAAHCVWINDRDIRLLKINDVKVAHCPVSNLYLASGIAPISKMVTQGVTVGIGTDDANCNESVNMIQAMKIAALVQRGVTKDASALTSEKVVEMSTIDAAKAIGLDREIGSLEAGKKADVIVVDSRHPQLRPLHHIPNGLVYQAYGCEVETVIVDGRIAMKDRKLSFLDGKEEVSLYREAQKLSSDIARRANLQGLDREWRVLGG
jgi:atrazine chlorohydrolase/5-methylthioadenosine/S-adenosylhomocysteine deaminase/melamine deaminase